MRPFAKAAVALGLVWVVSGWGGFSWIGPGLGDSHPHVAVNVGYVLIGIMYGGGDGTTDDEPHFSFHSTESVLPLVHEPVASLGRELRPRTRSVPSVDPAGSGRGCRRRLRTLAQALHARNVRLRRYNLRGCPPGPCPECGAGR